MKTILNLPLVEKSYLRRKIRKCPPGASFKTHETNIDETFIYISIKKSLIKGSFSYFTAWINHLSTSSAGFPKISSRTFTEENPTFARRFVKVSMEYVR